VECKMWEASLNVEFLYGFIVHDTFSCDPASGCSVSGRELPADYFF
jgi:hypothetical protein